MAPSERSALAFLHLEAAAGAPTAFKYLAMAAEASENTLGAHAARKGLLRATLPKGSCEAGLGAVGTHTCPKQGKDNDVMPCHACLHAVDM